MTLTIIIDQKKPCAKCGAKGVAQNGLCLRCIAEKLKGEKGAKIVAKTQQNLFGERDFVVNTLETERKMLQDEVEATMSSIQKKEEKLKELKQRIENISSSIASIRNAAEAEKKKAETKKEKGGE